MKLIFASHNPHKAEEIKSFLGEGFEIVTLPEAGITEDIPEPYETLEENASAKSGKVYELTETDCFSEDTGLEVRAMYGEPGVKSARYAGEEKSFQKNIEKLLHKMQDKNERSARFRSVISLIIDGVEMQFEGICEGQITRNPKGNSGFGYDPVFIPEGETRTFAEMNMEEKNDFNHRIKAIKKMVAYLQSLNKQTV